MPLENVLTKSIFGLSRPIKRTIQITSDMVLIVLCFWMAMALRIDGIFTEIQPKSWITMAVVIPTTILLFARLGLYRAVVRYMTEKAAAVIVLGAASSAAIMFATSQYFTLEVPRSVPGIYFSLLALTTSGTRLIMRTIYLTAKDVGRTPVAIYGAGEAGHLLMRSLQDSRNYRPYLFIDDDQRLHGTTIAGTQILSLQAAKKKILAGGVKTALIAIGNNNLKGQREAAANMVGLGLEVRVIPDISDLVSGKVKISSLRRINIEDLLGRDTVEPDPALMSQTTKGRSVLITGAGGSIGSELCRQAVSQYPRRLVLVDVSEYALYTITEELTATAKQQGREIELVSVLGSVTQTEVIEKVITANDVETIFHAAAYKHVPLVEQNAREAVRNNALGTHLMAQTAGRLRVKHFVLISTDKAVRPTNIMGATKRLAELSVSAAARAHPHTKFCSVRFGNVLGSSGSVIPKFEKQIQQGGPITLTHPDVTRYFMTIPEAAQLVIQASAMAERGNVFLLDMGEPIRILDLAKTMCALHAMRLRTDGITETPEGDIALEIIGLRPGEKLYEELLVTGSEVNTSHSKIKCEITDKIETFDVGSAIDCILNLKDNAMIAKYLSTLPLDYEIDNRYHS